MILLVPFSWLSFYAFNLLGSITGGLIQNVQGLAGLFGEGGDLIMILLGAVLGVVIVCLFPVHWVIIYRPGDLILLIALLLPWILSCSISSGLFAHTIRGSIHTSLAIGIGYFILMLIPYIALAVLLSQAGLNGAAIIDSVAIGLTGMPWVLAALAATMEGAGIGMVFALLVTVILKYKPEASSSDKKGIRERFRRSRSTSDYVYEPTLDEDEKEPTLSSSTPLSGISGAVCSNCGAKLGPDDEFCTNCGTKV
ncbi:MAG: zinc-ribbon domain-containing protein [Candidatus Lokiarchaeota archaeon]|nr:zinc-ribbon domain-containing protein [Candidatus Lokiarchaeota archaeon]MBD3339700.1 zinc-ribbon domain-containing protein [Candidatus Lokiarchaeota archaeon]